VAKNPYLASGLKLNLDLRPDDGNLWLVGVHGKTRMGFCRIVPRYYSGSVTRMSGVLLRRCQKIAIRSQTAQEIEFDGDPRGYLPAAIRILPKALNMIAGGER
jgi:diacylglycerol kinase family enzyme